MAGLSVNDLFDIFIYHAPSAEDAAKFVAIRKAGLDLARAILENTPACPDQSAAIRKIREAVMTANAAISLRGKF